LCIIKSPFKLENLLDLDVLGKIFPLSGIGGQINDFRGEKSKKYSLNDIKNEFNDEKEYYHLAFVLNIVDLDQRANKTSTSKFSDIIDPTIGLSVQRDYIIDDVLNLLSFSFGTFFTCIALFDSPDPVFSFKILHSYGIWYYYLQRYS
jgi:hypothetical protein